MRKFQRLAVAGAMAALVLAPAGCTSSATPAAPSASSAPAAAPSATAEPVPASGGITTAAQVMGASCAKLLPQGDAAGSLTAIGGQPVAAAVAANPQVSSFASAMSKVPGFAEALNAQKGLTLFVPSDTAFADVQQPGGAASAAVLADPRRTDALLSHHVVGRRYDAAGLAKAGKVAALAGGELTFGGTAEAPTVTSSGGVTATIICGNIPTSNATVFVIDKVLQPKS